MNFCTCWSLDPQSRFWPVCSPVFQYTVSNSNKSENKLAGLILVRQDYELGPFGSSVVMLKVHHLHHLRLCTNCQSPSLWFWSLWTFYQVLFKGFGVFDSFRHRTQRWPILKWLLAGGVPAPRTLLLAGYQSGSAEHTLDVLDSCWLECLVECNAENQRQVCNLWPPLPELKKKSESSVCWTNQTKSWLVF